MKKSAEKYVLYRYRFWIAFVLLAIFAVSFAVLDFSRIPNGLTATEISSGAAAGQLNFGAIVGGSADFANLPFLILQHFSIKIFGFSTFALRFPSVILMLLAAAALIFAILRYQKKNIAVMAGFLLVSSSLFISLARSGSAGSMTIFLLAVMSLAVILLLREKTSRWFSTALKILLCVATALLIYSPGGIFVAILLAALGLLHPTTRYEIFRNKWYKFALGCFAAFVIILPLFIAAFHGNFDWNLFGLAHWNFANFASTFGVFFIVGGGLIGGIAAPALNACVILLAFYGMFRLFREINSVRARFVLPLFILALALSLGDPNLAFWLLVPIIFALASGLDGLVESWYKLFPRNPYARIFALPLIAILILFAGFSSASDYFAANFYNSRIISALDREFEAARTKLSRNKSQILIVPKNQLSFYENFSRDFPKLKITDKFPEKFAKNTLVLNSANAKTSQIPTKILTDELRENSILLREY